MAERSAGAGDARHDLFWSVARLQGHDRGDRSHSQPFESLNATSPAGEEVARDGPEGLIDDQNIGRPRARNLTKPANLIQNLDRLP